MEHCRITVEGAAIVVTNPDKVLWPEPGITKLDYIRYLLLTAPYLVPYTFNRLLMMWRYPEGIEGKRIEEKAVPAFAPEWIPRAFYKDKDWILINNAPTLAWVANLAALELHVPFDRYDHKNYPTELVFDLDPSDIHHFELAVEVAFKLKEVLDSLSLYSVVKTSGGSGLQIYVPIKEEYTFEETRKINKFIATYLTEQMPAKITLERAVHKRGFKLYFDYLQLWKGRTMPAPYSVRAKPLATVSAPVTWEELSNGIHPNDFTILTMEKRLRQTRDLFAPLTTDKPRFAQDLRNILSFLTTHEGTNQIDRHW